MQILHLRTCSPMSHEPVDELTSRWQLMVHLRNEATRAYIPAVTIEVVIRHLAKARGETIVGSEKDVLELTFDDVDALVALMAAGRRGRGGRR